MRQKLLAAFMICAMIVFCVPVAASEPIIETSDPKAVSALLKNSSPYRILLMSDSLVDCAGAARAIHCTSTNSYILEYPSAKAAESALCALRSLYGASSCCLDCPSEGACVLDESETENTFRSWGAHALELDEIQTAPKVSQHLRSGAVMIAVIDTGLDPESSFWKNRSISPKSYDFVNASASMSEVPNGSAAGHGTMVVSILDDLLPEKAELMILRVFDNTGSASRARVLNALEYAIDNGADVINLSLGWEGADSSFTFLNGVLDKAHEQGIPVICASGNRGTDANTCYPASYKTTISVSAVSDQGEHPAYSNYGQSVDLTAPGQKIRTIGLKDRLMSSTGTSFAAPHITASAAALFALNPELNAEQIFSALKDNAKDIGEAGWDPYYGWGLPQMMSAAEFVLAHNWDEGHDTVEPTSDLEGERVYTCTVCGEQRTETIPPVTPTPTPSSEPSAQPTETPDSNQPFTDVSTGAYYYHPVLWAIGHEPQITVGTDASHFSPNQICSRAQVVTFLWRAMGQPTPDSGRNPFSDIKKSDYYYSAVLWAVEQGITVGTASDQFSPNRSCTRAQVVTFLWRAEHQPEASAMNTFSDVSPSQYYFKAVNWAISHSPRITEGTDASHFTPNAFCTRGQIVTFLYRDLAK